MDLSALPPTWWSQPDSAGRKAVDPAATDPNNYGPANIGQAKFMAKRALESLRNYSPAVAGKIESDLVGVGKIIPNWTVPTAGTDLAKDQYSPLQIGQLKAIAAPFYQRLNAYAPSWLNTQLVTNLTKDGASPTNYFPWTATPSDDDNRAIATVGQLKAVFSLRFDALPPLGSDTDLDGLPNDWEVANGLDPNASGDAMLDSDSDGFNNLREYYMGSNPNDGTNKPVGILAAGGDHTVGLTASGRAWAWGYNANGRLGDRTVDPRRVPEPVAQSFATTKFVSIRASKTYTMALDENGQLWGWGYNPASSNVLNQSAGATQFNSPVKVSIPGTTVPVARFACGDSHVVAVDRSGKIWAWGSNDWGALGTGATVGPHPPVEVPKHVGMGRVVDVVASYRTSYAIDGVGKVWAWGYNNSGQVGDDTTTTKSSPVPIYPTSNLPKIKSLSSFYNHVLAVGDDNSVWAWGANSTGQLGNNSTSYQKRPVAISGGMLSSVLSTTGLLAVAGEAHSLVALVTATDGDVLGAWGSNYNGRLGINSTSTANFLLPQQVYKPTTGGLEDAVSVAAGGTHCAALKKDGSVWTWGYNYYGQLGHGAASSDQIEPLKITSFKLSDDDSDSDGLPDSWEYRYFGNLAQTSTGVSPQSGITYLAAYSNGLNPTVADNDADGMPDQWELLNGFDPMDSQDALSDKDGDRIPNLWEYKRGTEPGNSASKPPVFRVVDAPLAGTDNYVATITQAISAAPAFSTSDPTTYVVIEVRSKKTGTPTAYKETVLIPSNKRIVLLGELGYPSTEITREHSEGYALDIRSDSFVDGFRVSRAEDPDDRPYNSNSAITISSPATQVSLSNLIIHGHRAGSGAGVFCSSGRVRLNHCTMYDNGAGSWGNSIYVASNASLDIRNCIIRGGSGAAAQQISNNSTSGTVNVSSSFISSGEFGANSADPQINPLGWLKTGSPAINAGLVSNVTKDINNEARVGSPDAGADEFVDSDADGLPDWFESLGATGAAGADNEPDGLVNLQEYEITGTNPLVADADEDGLNDGGELLAGTNPFDDDSDNDGMTDGWEVANSLMPTSDLDALEDADGDRIPNVYEFVKGKNPRLASSRPDVQIMVKQTSAADTGTVKKTIQAAINQASSSDLTIIQVSAHATPPAGIESGVYTESLDTGSKRILLLADLGVKPIEIRAVSNGTAVSIGGNSTVVDGFLLTGKQTLIDEQAINVDTLGESDQVRLVNCTIRDFTANTKSAVYVNQGRLSVVHSTVMDNSSPKHAGGFEVQSGSLFLKNSIVWNPVKPATAQIYLHPSGGAVATAANCIIKGGELGAISAAPLVDRYHCLMPGSPAIGAGAGLFAPSVDRHGESRPASNPDIGADQYHDTDTDSLSDWWETLNFGNLTKTATGDSETSVDRLTNRYEYLLGFDPKNPDTRGNLREDLFNAVFVSAGDPWYPAEWSEDSDLDGLTDGQELYYATSPTNADTNGDGVPDKEAILGGISATSTDTDGDGVTNVQELANGTNPLLKDSDGDETDDNSDFFPLDPNRQTAPSVTLPDTTPPDIELLIPENATPINP